MANVAETIENVVMAELANIKIMVDVATAESSTFLVVIRSAAENIVDSCLMDDVEIISTEAANVAKMANVATTFIALNLEIPESGLLRSYIDMAVYVAATTVATFQIKIVNAVGIVNELTIQKRIIAAVSVVVYGTAVETNGELHRMAKVVT